MSDSDENSFGVPKISSPKEKDLPRRVYVGMSTEGTKEVQKLVYSGIVTLTKTPGKKNLH